MALIDRKVSDWSQSVSSLDDKPQMTAADLKAAFDSNSNQLKPAINGIIDDLTGSQGASNIGLTPIDGLSGSNVQAVLQAISLLIKSNDVNISSLKRLFTSDGANLVGLQPINGISGGNIQQAIISLADTISKIDPYLGNPVAISQGGTGAKDNQNALYNLGAKPNDNLLCNSYFIGGGTYGNFPINQKRKKEYGNIYGIDAWKAQSISLVRLISNGIAVFIDALGGLFFQKTPLLKIGETYTLSVLANSVSSVCSIGAWDGGETKMLNGLTSHTFVAKQGTLDNGVYIIRKSQKSETQASAVIYAAKLEEGDKQTLARKVANGTGIGGTSWELLETPDYSAELLKCQQYYQLYSCAEKRPTKAIDCRPVMRINPTQTTIQIDGVTYYVNDASI